MSFSKFKFCDLVDYIQPTKYQVKTKESIQEKGNISVLTPGKSFVLGFTNESEGIFYASKENPIILFDDFTCSSQWVDFNFKVRSSACKILILKDNVKNITSLRFLFHLMKKIKVNINAIRHNNVAWSARVIAREIADAIENRVSFRLAQKMAISKVMRSKALGIKTNVSGRLGGVEMAREEGYSEGVIPMNTIRSDLDYALEEAHTTYGLIGVKVWINRGEIFKKGLNNQIIPPKPTFEQRGGNFKRNNKRGNFNRHNANSQKPKEGAK